MAVIERVQVVVDGNGQTVLGNEQEVGHGTVDRGPYMVGLLVMDVMAQLTVSEEVDLAVEVYHPNRPNRHHYHRREVVPPA
jgi:hypothetical protein